VRVTEAFPGEADAIERARTDAEAFGVLYEHYVPLIFRYVFNRVRDRTIAEDLTSEVFFKALRAIDRYRPTNKPFGAWLYRVANFTVIDHIRTHRSTLDLEAIVERPDSQMPVDEQVARRADVQRVWDAVAGLADAQRLAISLKLGQDMHTSDIAACMGRSEGAVKLLIHRGLTTIRRKLQEPAPCRQEA
jgi:RNA polymerase sigma-70 factor (ECF subfamily)